MAVGKLRAVVIDVNELAEGERFWSEMSGKAVRFSGWAGRYSRLDRAGEGSILLQLVPEDKPTPKNRVHVDLTVDNVASAVEKVIALGGRLQKPPALYPSDDDPVIEWAVMLDPFGNEFCLIRDLPPPDGGK
jgi:predicted enzyme related to lactoylglutathione lyase